MRISVFFEENVEMVATIQLKKRMTNTYVLGIIVSKLGY